MLATVRRIRGLVCAVLAVSLVTPARAADTKVATLDMERVFQGFYKTGRSDAAFKKQKEAYDQHAEDLAAECDAYKKQRDELQERALNIALSDDVRDASRKGAEEKDATYREKRQELKDFVQNKEKELGKKYLELRAGLVKEILDFVRDYAKRGGFDLILDGSGLTRNFIPAVVYAKDELDMTEAVLAEINRGHEDEVPKKTEGDAATTPRLGPVPGADGGM